MQGGYAHEQATRPHTLAVGLGDSPAGRAAWIVEKLRAWSDCGGDVESVFTRDELLTWVMAYWVTGTIRTFAERFSDVRVWDEQPAGGHFAAWEQPAAYVDGVRAAVALADGP